MRTSPETATTDELVRQLIEGEAGAAGINVGKTLRTHANKLERALRGLLYVIENDDLVPESVSFMQQAREALKLPPPYRKKARQGNAK